jgi:surface protein
MKVFRRLLIAMIVLLTSCEKEPDVSTEQPPSPSQREVKIDIILNLNFELKLSGSDSKNLPNPGYNTEDGFSDFDHVFADQIDLVFNSTTSDYTNTLTFNPNDLSTPPTIIIPYGSYTWSIEDKTPQNPMRDYVLRDYLPVFGGGALEIASQSVVLNLNVDSDFGLVTVEKALIDSAKIINSGQYEKEMKVKGDYLYLYVFDSAENEIEITESVFNTTIKRQIDDTGIVEAKKHYNYYLRVSETSVNSITIESGPFEKKDYALIPGPVYLDANGVTVRARGDAEVGKTYIVNGIEYLVVNETILRNMAVDWRNNDLTKVVTTKVTSFEGLFWYELYDWFAEKNQAHQMYEGLPEDHFDEFNQDLGSWDTSNVTHMGGLFERTAFNHDISKWDTSKVTHMWYMFAYTQNFEQDLSWMDTSNVVYMNKMFKESSFNGDISGWDVGKVENMTNMFEGSMFNGDLSQWDTSSVKYMSGMFTNSEFNQPIGSWNVSNVIDMSFMFYSNINDKPTVFNQPIGSWDVSSVRSMSNMFKHSSFNQPLGSWNVGNVTDMTAMFSSRTGGIGAYRTPFDQDISSWDVRNVTTMSAMFSNSAFNKPIGNWDVSNVTDTSFMFNGTPNFNQELSAWNVGKVTDMTAMFQDAESFNQDIANWNTSSVIDMSYMFSGNEGFGSGNPDVGGTSFNKPIGDWDVSNVTNMNAMFQGSPFDQDLTNWNTSSVTKMSYMFSGASFNQAIGNWDVSKVLEMNYMFQGSDFNKDLTNWCVSLISTEPEGFVNNNSALSEGNKPIWGTCPDCSGGYSDDFSNGLAAYTYSGGTIEVRELDGNDVLYMSHFAGEQSHNFFKTGYISGNGTYRVSAYNTTSITDHIIYLLEDESLGSGITLSFRPNGTDNPGFSIIHGGQTFYSTTQIPVNRNAWYDIRIQLDSDLLTIYLDDTEYYSVNRSELGFSDRSEGYFKLGTAFIGYFDNLSYQCIQD